MTDKPTNPPASAAEPPSPSGEAAGAAPAPVEAALEGDAITRGKLHEMLKRHTAAGAMMRAQQARQGGGAGEPSDDADGAPVGRPYFLDTVEYQRACELAGASPEPPATAAPAGEQPGGPRGEPASGPASSGEQPAVALPLRHGGRRTLLIAALLLLPPACGGEPSPPA